VLPVASRLFTAITPPAFSVFGCHVHANCPTTSAVLSNQCERVSKKHRQFRKMAMRRVALGLRCLLAMLMLRNGGKFTDQQIRKYLKKALFCFAIAVVGIFAMRYIQIPLIGLITTMLAITLFKANFTRWGNWFVGKRGEMAISDALGSLSDDYIVLNDLMLPDGKGNVDHLVMGPNGLFAIETKNYSTFVKCSGDDWFVNGKKIRSLSKQAKRNAIAVRENLAAVFADQGNRLPFVTALLVFVNGKGRFSIKNPTIPVLRSSELAEFIARYNSARPPSITSPELRRAIVHHLHLLQQKPDKLVANS